MEIMELESTITEMKNILEGLNSRFRLHEERISGLEDKYRLYILKNMRKIK